MRLVEPENLKRPRRKSLLGQLVLLLVGVQLIFFGAFTCLDLPTATGGNLKSYFHRLEVAAYRYVPQAQRQYVERYYPRINDPVKEVRYSPYCLLPAVAIFVGYTLGPNLALWSAGIFFLAGIVGPFLGLFPFASGGGLSYYEQPGFGYLLGFVFAAWTCGFITQKKRTSLSQLAGVLAGLTVLHLIGIAYLLGAYLFFYLVEGSKSYLEWQPWIFQYVRNLTWYSLPYDVFFSILLVGAGHPFRWLATTLTAPDVAPRQPRTRYNRKTLEEIGVG